MTRALASSLPGAGTILIVGSGPAVIGDGVGFDAAGVQACRGLRQAGFEVVAVDSKTTAILTDAEIANRAYVEPLTTDAVAQVIERERPDALLPTLGGPAAASLAVALAEDGTLARCGVELIGVTAETIRLTQDPARFAEIVTAIGLGRPSGSVAGLKEVALEIAHDGRDVAVVCSIEHLDPAGIHPGDAIAVAPAQTLSDQDTRRLRDAAVAIVRRVGGIRGVATLRFALNPRDGRLAALSLSPHVTRSSALAGAAAGVRVGEVAARLAAGAMLDELGPALPAGGLARERCVVKIPCWAFDTFPEVDRVLTDRPASVGEAIGVGRTFEDALQKAARAVAPATSGLTLGRVVGERELIHLLTVPTPERLGAIADACRAGWSTADLHALTRIDPWFLDRVRDLVSHESVVATHGHQQPGVLRLAKPWSVADATHGAARVVILGPGPTRIGQGAEIDHGCVHAAGALRALGVEAVMVSCNPAALSTDPQMSDRVHVEPLTLECVQDVVERERPLGVIVQLGGGAAQALAGPLAQAGVNILGTGPDAMARASDRRRLGAVLADLGLRGVPGGTAETPAEARAIAERLGYPVLVRSSRAGAGTRLVHNGEDLQAVTAGADAPIHVETFLEDAVAVDVDAVSDGRHVLVAGVMEQIEKVGVHPGDAACVLPPYSLGPDQVARLHDYTAVLARGLGVVGLLNVRFALHDDRVHVLAVHPYASRTVPFVSKATGIPLVALATEVMLGRPLRTIAGRPAGVAIGVAIKEAVFPFGAFAGVDVVLGPTMKSTGDVMGVAGDVRHAYLKSQLAAGARLPTGGTVWISVRPCDRRPIVMLAKRLAALGFSVVAAGDTARLLTRHAVDVRALPPGDAEHPQVQDLMRAGAIALAVDIPEDGRARARSAPARREALRQAIPYYTTLDGAQAVIGALEVLITGDAHVSALHQRVVATASAA